MDAHTRDHHTDDGELVHRARAGQAAAIDALVARLGCVRRLLADAHERLGAPLDAAAFEDLVADALAAAWEALGSCTGPVTLEATACRAAHARLLARLRPADAAHGDGHGTRHAPPAPVAVDLAALERAERAWSLLARLERADAELLARRHLEGLGLADIAAADHEPLEATAGRYVQALAAGSAAFGLRAPSAASGGVHETGQHELRLREVAAAGSDLRVAFRASSLAHCRACAERIEALATVADALAEVGRRERAARVPAGASVPGGRAEAALRARLAGQGAPAGKPHVGLLGFAASVALIALLVATSGGGGEGGGSAHAATDASAARTSSAVARPLYPVGPVASWDVFRITDPPSRSRWRVRVFDAGAAPGDGALHESPWLTGNEWAPPPAVVREWPLRIRWRLEVVVRGGPVVAEAEAELVR